MIPSNLFLYILLTSIIGIALFKELILLTISFLDMLDRECDPDNPTCCIDC